MHVLLCPLDNDRQKHEWRLGGKWKKIINLKFVLNSIYLADLMDYSNKKVEDNTRTKEIFILTEACYNKSYETVLSHEANSEDGHRGEEESWQCADGWAGQRYRTITSDEVVASVARARVAVREVFALRAAARQTSSLHAFRWKLKKEIMSFFACE